MRDRRLVAGAGVLLALVGYAVVVPLLLGSGGADLAYDAVRRPPSAEHPFGTDSLGRDVFLVTALGLRVSLLVAAASALVGAALGLAAGAALGTGGGWLDRVGMRVVDAVNALPHLLLGIVVVALYRGSVLAVVASIALVHWTSVARLVRADLLSLREREFVDAAVLAGAGRRQVAVRHLAPAVAPQAGVAAVLMLPHAVWHESALSFLGLGLPAHLPSLGTLLADSRAALLLGAWWQVAFPALVLVAATLAVSGIGAAARDLSSPRRRTEVVL